ncbi:MAG TPA: polysaccharide lyase family protein [Candidatus Limnocylindrales bacterium]|nr:polysaccharide lyase family protein [Candidatus Limnocylindrales bacterium]
MQSLRCGISFLLFALLVLVAARPANSQSKNSSGEIVWQIGQFDQSSRELNHDFDPSSPNFNPVFTVGQTKAADWPAFQNTFIESATGKHPTPYTILFDMPKPPSGTFKLTISVILNRPAVPDLLVDINGRKGLYYFDRKASYYPGDGGVDSPIYGGDQIEIVLPAGALHQGQNKLILTAVNDADNPVTSSYLLYDALSLTRDASTRLEPSASVKPTVFYTQKDGELRELTRVTVTLPEKARSGEVRLSVGKQNFHADLAAANDFGQQRFDFEVPEFTHATEANVSVTLNGRKHSFSVAIAPERKWTIYFVPHAHLDIGYTDYQAKVAAVQTRNIDKLLDYIPQNPAMRFSLDGSWIAQNYLATRSDLAKAQFLQLAREGKLRIPAEYANLLTGYASLEELIRSLEYSASLHRTEGVPFDYANITDVPSITWSYPSVLSAAGLKYFAEATNSDRGPIVLFGRWNEKSPFWREGPDGSKVLMANTRQYSQLWFVCDLPPEISNCRQGLPTFLQQFESPDYKPDAVLMFGSQLENTDLRVTEADFVPKWNSDFAFPKFVVSTFPDYFRYIEKNYGSQLATVTGDGGPYWEDGVGSDAANTAIDRDDQSRALSAEKLSTISTFLNPALAAPRQLIDRMWTNLLLYAEHTWDSWDSVYQPDSQESVRQLGTKDHYVAESKQAVDSIVEQSLSEIANQIHMPAPSLVVFNTLSWNRSGLVEMDLDRDRILVEYPGKTPVPFEVLREGPSYQHVRFLARDVPAMGFNCYFLQESKERKPVGAASSETQQPASFENSFYRVEVDPATGAVKSIFDKQLQRELVDASSPYRFDQYLYVEGGGKPESQIVYMQRSLPFAKLTIDPSTNGRVVSLRETPYGQIMTLESKDAHTPSIRTEILLFNDEKKIEFVNHFTKDAVRDKEAVYFAFPIATPKPAFTYEVQNGSVDPNRDMLKGAGLEWFSVGHWVKESAGAWEAAIVPVDAPLVTLGDINRGVWPETFDPKSPTIFSYALNNYWHTNYRAEQGGDFTFRYTLTSGATLAPQDLSRFGREEMTPLESGQLIDNDKVDDPDRPLAAAPFSFLQVDGADVSVENWKAADDGHGTILRLLEIGGRSGTARLTFPLLQIDHAWIASAVEENQKEIPVSGSSIEIPVQPHQILTLRIEAAPKKKM